MERIDTNPVSVGNVKVGGGAPVSIQSMLKCPAGDAQANIGQALELKASGCQILRVAVPDFAAVKTLAAVKEASGLPVVADIHFDYRLALESVQAGADKIRINPGNIGSQDRVKAVARACAARHIPIRIGVNSGSVEKRILAKYGGPTADAMCESALYHASLLNRFDFDDIVVSLKSSDVLTTMEAYEKMSLKSRYPLHLGVTEAGTERMGLIKSTVGIGSLLAHGIGDTIRVSLTAGPVREIEAAKDILSALGLRRTGVEIISCPTCGRTKIDIVSLAAKAEEMLKDVDKPLKVAIMGCVVNGPGEAREADVGITGGNGEGLIFKKGKIVRKVPEEKLLSELLTEIEKM